MDNSVVKILALKIVAKILNVLQDTPYAVMALAQLGVFVVGPMLALYNVVVVGAAIKADFHVKVVRVIFNELLGHLRIQNIPEF